MQIDSRPEPIRLRITGKNSQVVIEPEDRDLFVMFVQEAIEACKVYQDYKNIFEKQLEHLKDLLGRWASEHLTKLDGAFLTLLNGRFLFVVVTKQQAFDPALEDELSSLDINIAQDENCSQLNVDVQALPKCDKDAYMSFCNPKWTLEYQKA